MRELKNKVIVITGAASGIGKALAFGLAKRGAHLALVDINYNDLTELALELETLPVKVSSHIADVGDKDRMQTLPLEISNCHDSIDILINNAGVSVGAMFDEHSIEDAEWLLNINLLGVIYGCKFFMPYLKQAPEAHIVNLSSMFGLFSMPGQAMYSASKAGVRFFSEALWTELATTNIHVTTVHPGTIRSNVIASSRMQDPEQQARSVAMQHRYGMDTDKAAEKIIRAIEKNKLRVLVGTDAYLTEYLKCFLPVSFQRLLTFIFKRANLI